MTNEEIITTGQTIKNETHIGGNTAERVGGVIEGIGKNLTELGGEVALGAVYDVSVHNNNATFASLSALLSDANLDTLIPTAVRKGGMSIKFVQSSDNKYVQYRLTKNTWSTIESDWQCYFESEYDPKGDLNFADENDNTILSLRGGHVVTKNFDSRKQVEYNAKVNQDIEDINDNIEEIEQNAPFASENASDSLLDLGFKDANEYFVLVLRKGHLITKYFDSRKTNITEDNVQSSVDLSIQDEQNNMLFCLSEGHLMTKHFDSRNLQIAKSHLLTDLEFSDTNGRSVLALLNGDLITKNFNSRKVLKKISELEEEIHSEDEHLSEWSEDWSRMPKTESNPLAKVRFDGGMCRVFRNWGFIGDSLNSGEMYGYRTSILSVTPTSGKAISTTGLIDDQSSVCSDLKTISGYQPKIRLNFSSNAGLNEKILMVKQSDNEYTAVITGSTDKTYTVSLNSGDKIYISWPTDNEPEILFQVTYVNDNYDLSWGQQICRLIGATGWNFSVGGEYCKRWCIGEDNNRRWVKAQTDLKDVYTIALGVNDRGYWMSGYTSTVDYPCVTAYPNQSQYGHLTLTEQEILQDVDDSNYNNNANSYAGWYAGIIQRVKSVRKDAHIFCITNPVGASEWNQVIRCLVEHFRSLYGNTIWLIDLETYNPITSAISSNCDLNGHLSAFGYLYSAYQISTYIDWLIRNNINDFRGTSLIGTGSTVNQFDKIFINN